MDHRHPPEFHRRRVTVEGKFVEADSLLQKSDLSAPAFFLPVRLLPLLPRQFLHEGRGRLSQTAGQESPLRLTPRRLERLALVAVPPERPPRCLDPVVQPGDQIVPAEPLTAETLDDRPHRSFRNALRTRPLEDTTVLSNGQQLLQHCALLLLHHLDAMHRPGGIASQQAQRVQAGENCRKSAVDAFQYLQGLFGERAGRGLRRHVELRARLRVLLRVLERLGEGGVDQIAEGALSATIRLRHPLDGDADEDGWHLADVASVDQGSEG